MGQCAAWQETGIHWHGIVKRLLFTPLLAVACAPGIASQSASLPLHPGQVWQYTVTESGKAPRTGTIRVNSPNEPRLNGIVSDDLRYPHDAILFYSANRKQLLLNLYAGPGGTITGCTFNTIDGYQSDFSADCAYMAPTKDILGTCSLKRLK